jgi:hypothetical protein
LLLLSSSSSHPPPPPFRISSFDWEGRRGSAATMYRVTMTNVAEPPGHISCM